MNLFISSAFAQATTQTQAANQPSALMSFLPFILIFLIFYFLMIRPQKKKMQEEEKMLSTLSKGDEVYTKSGLIGTIHGVSDKVVNLEVAEGVRIKVLKGHIGGSSKKLFDKKEDASVTH